MPKAVSASASAASSDSSVAAKRSWASDRAMTSVEWKHVYSGQRGQEYDRFAQLGHGPPLL